MSEVPDNAVLNDAGQIAMKYKRKVPLHVRCGGHPNYITYIFIIRANIPMAWVNPEHLPCMANVTYSCCSGQKRGGAIFANEDDVRRWTNGGGR